MDRLKSLTATKQILEGELSRVQRELRDVNECIRRIEADAWIKETGVTLDQVVWCDQPGMHFGFSLHFNQWLKENRPDAKFVEWSGYIHRREDFPDILGRRDGYIKVCKEDLVEGR